MASIKDNLVTKLIGFEEGINIRNLEQVSNTIRPRFVPLSNPKIAFTEKSIRKYSVVLKIDSIPEEPGDGNFTLKIESPIAGQDLIIRAVGENKSKSTLTINDSVSDYNDVENLNFSLINQRKFLKQKSAATIVFQDNSTGTITLRSGIESQEIQIDESGDAAARALDFSNKVNSSLNNSVYSLITAENKSNLVFLEQSETGDSGNTRITAAGDSNIVFPPHFSNGDGRNATVNFRFSSKFENPSRVRRKNWIIGTKNANSKSSILDSVEATLIKASEEGELEYNITRSGDSLVIESKFAGSDRNHKPTGDAITSQKISLPDFTGGSLGSLATENTGEKTHPRDSSVYALGLVTPPSYYSRGGDGTRYREVLESNSQKIKRVTFDINNIINYHKSRTAISSTIVGDDTLLITHKSYGGYNNSLSEGKKIYQNGLSKIASIKFSSSNWKLTSNVGDSNQYRDDISFESIFEKEKRKIVIPLDNPNLIFDPNVGASDTSRYCMIHFTVLGDNIAYPRYKVIVLTSDDPTNKEVPFNIETVLVDAREKSVFWKINQEHIEKIITIYPRSGAQLIPSDLEPRSIRDNFFQILKSALEACSVPLTMVVDPLTKELSIEEEIELTNFMFSNDVHEASLANDNEGRFLSINNAIAEELQRYGFTVSAQENNQPYRIRVLFNSGFYNQKGPMRELTDQYGTAKIYLVGTEGVEKNRDLKNRLENTLAIAKRKGDLPPNFRVETSTPYIRFFYRQSDSLSNLNTSLYGQTFTIGFLEKGGPARTNYDFFFSNGGASGMESVRNGKRLAAGDAIANGVNLAEDSPYIGFYNIKINRNSSAELVLEQMVDSIRKAVSPEGIFTKTGIEVSNVIDDFGVGSRANANFSFNIYYYHHSSNNAEIRDISVSGNAIGTNSFPNFDQNEPNKALSSSTLKIYSSEDYIALDQTRTFENLVQNEFITLDQRYTLEDFSEESNSVRVNFRDGEKPYYFLAPNHDVQIRSYGFGEQRSQLSHYEDLTVHGRVFKYGFQNFKNTNYLDPVFYIESSSEIRFPIRLKNIGSHLGFEMDGVIEPLELREVMLGRTISEKPMRSIKGALLGSYSYCPRRDSSTVINNNLDYENSNVTPYFDNELIKADYMEVDVRQIMNTNSSREKSDFSKNFYFAYQGIIFKNDEKMFPFIDIEEKHQQNNVLSGNNPEETELDPVVISLNKALTVDKTNLGVENFKRTSGFQFSSNPHPGSDVFVFGGLKYV